MELRTGFFTVLAASFIEARKRGDKQYKRAALPVPLLREKTCSAWEEAVFQALGRRVLRPLEVQSVLCVAVYSPAPTWRLANLLGCVVYLPASSEMSGALLHGCVIFTRLAPPWVHVWRNNVIKG